MFIDGEVIPAYLLSDSTRSPVDEKLVNDLKQILVSTKSRKNQMEKFWSITKKLLEPSQSRMEIDLPCQIFLFNHSEERMI